MPDPSLTRCPAFFIDGYPIERLGFTHSLKLLNSPSNSTRNRRLGGINSFSILGIESLFGSLLDERPDSIQGCEVFALKESGL
jgi:hypothetical protein